MLDYEKIGNFLRELREKHGLSQQMLGHKVYVSRQAVSQWELGKCFPDLETSVALAKLYGISIADIYAGEIITNKDKYNSVMEFIIKSEMKRVRKIITLLVITICTLLLIFLSYYFFNVYNKISVYTVDTIEKPYIIHGVINKSVKDIYINFEINKTLDNVCLIYNDTKLKCMKDSNYLVIKESIGYNEQLPELSKINFNDFINNLYVEINNEQKIKLNINKDYKNDNLLFNSDDETVNYNEQYNSNNNDIPEKVKNNFEKIDDNCYSMTKKTKDKQIEIRYIINDKIINVKEIQNNISKSWKYDIPTKTIIIYDVYNLISNRFVYKYNNKSNENMNKKDIDYFNDNYLNKYIY